MCHNLWRPERWSAAGNVSARSVVSLHSTRRHHRRPFWAPWVKACVLYVSRSWRHAVLVQRVGERAVYCCTTFSFGHCARFQSNRVVFTMTLRSWRSPEADTSTAKLTLRMTQASRRGKIRPTAAAPVWPRTWQRSSTRTRGHVFASGHVVIKNRFD